MGKISRKTITCEKGYGFRSGWYDTCPKGNVYIIDHRCSNPNPDNFYTGWDCVYEILKVDEGDLPIEELRKFFLSDLSDWFFSWKECCYHTSGELEEKQTKYKIEKEFIEKASAEEIKLLYYITLNLANIRHLPAIFEYESGNLTFIIDDYHKDYNTRDYNTLTRLSKHLMLIRKKIGFPELKIFFRFPSNIQIEYEDGKTMKHIIMKNISDGELKDMFRDLVEDDRRKNLALNNAELFLSGKIKDPRNWSDLAKLIARRFPDIKVRKIKDLAEYFGKTHFLIVHYDPITQLPIAVYPIGCYDAGSLGSPDPCKLYKKRLRDDFCGGEWSQAYNRFTKLAEGLPYECSSFRNWYNFIPGKLRRVCPRDVQEIRKYLGNISELPVLVYPKENP